MLLAKLISFGTKLGWFIFYCVKVPFRYQRLGLASCLLSRVRSNLQNGFDIS
jgi:hypothetical protein